MAFGAPQGDNWVGVEWEFLGPHPAVRGHHLRGSQGTVVLENNGANDLSTSASSVRLQHPLGRGAPPTTSPSRPAQRGRPAPCTNPSGTVGTADVTNVSVACVNRSPPPRGRGHHLGLSGTVVLEDNGANDLSTSANGAFRLQHPLAEGAACNVTVKTNPTGQTCTSVTNPSGTVGTMPTSPTSRSPA